MGADDFEQQRRNSKRATDDLNTSLSGSRTASKDSAFVGKKKRKRRPTKNEDSVKLKMEFAKDASEPMDANAAESEYQA